jgi:hypothetical protein
MELLRTASRDLLEASKKQLFDIGKAAAEVDLETALQNPSEHLIAAKKALELLTGYVSEIQNAVHDEIYNTGEQGVIHVGSSSITLGSTGDRLDYMNDDVYASIHYQLKQREGVLKHVSTGGDKIFDSEGVEIKPVPLKSAAREIIKIKL